jgi:hypothetical protein
MSCFVRGATVRKGFSHLLSKKDDLGLFYKRWAKGGVESERPSQYFVVKGENWCKVTGGGGGSVMLFTGGRFLC